MDDQTAETMEVTTTLIPTEDPALSDSACAPIEGIGLGPSGNMGTWDHTPGKAELKAQNQATEDYLRGKPFAGQKAKTAKKLSKVAPRIFAAIRANPPDWLPEFDAFVKSTLGTRPSENFRHQAAMEWDAAVMFGILCWGYFGEMLAAEADEDDPATPEHAGEPVVDDAAGVSADAAAPEVLATPGTNVDDDAVVGATVDDVAAFKGSSLILDSAGRGSDTFAVLDAAGEPVIEGLR